jgi:hypothetical protein
MVKTTLFPLSKRQAVKVRPPEGKASGNTGRWRQRAYQGPEEPGPGMRIVLLYGDIL